MRHVVVEIIRWLYNHCIFSCAKIRANMYSLVCGKVGVNVHFLSGVRVFCPENVKVGDNTAINTFTILDGNGGLEIGSDVMIGPYCKIITANHAFLSRDLPVKEQGIITKPIVIEDDVWLGANVIVLPGVIVGKGAIVAAGAVVTHNVEPFHVVAGVPARTISIRPE